MANLSQLLLQLDSLSSDLRSTAVQSSEAEVPQDTAEQLQEIIMKLQGIKGAVETTRHTPTYVQAYQNCLGGAVADFLAHSDLIGGDVQEQAGLFKKAFEAQSTFLEVAMQSKPPPQAVLSQLLQPTLQGILEVQEFCQTHQQSPFMNHLYAMSDGVPALKWVTVDPPPGLFVKSMGEASQVNANVVLENFQIEEDMKHVNWVHALLKVFDELEVYVEQYHKTGLVWNVQIPQPLPVEEPREVAPVTIHAGEGPFLIPPEVLAVLTGGNSAQSDTQTDIIVLTSPDARGEADAVLAQINQGRISQDENVTKVHIPEAITEKTEEEEESGRSSKSKKKKSKKSKKKKRKSSKENDDSDSDSRKRRRKGKKGDDSLQCDHCDRVLSTGTSLRNHIKSQHTGERPHQCDLCDRSYVTISRLRDHKMTHTGERPHTCPICDKGFRTAYRLGKHAVVHTDERTHQCSLCDKKFKSAETRKIHETRHTSLRTFECPTCGKSYKTNHDMKRHQAVHHVKPEEEDQIHQCTTCGKQFRTAVSLRAHERTHQQHTKYQCSYCTTVFSSIRSLKTHEDVQHLGGAGKFQCSICGKVCSYRGGLTLHEKTHLGEKPFECTQCDKKFSRAYGLKRHFAIAHLNEKPYQCTYCDKAYNTDCEKRYHERTHTGDRPYQCSFCEKAYMMASHLSTHMRTHKDIIQIIQQ